ncbi:MAG TPA: RDD family protein [Actinomycetota bacterium]|nr:RDD family protein [Actinomycetota bacterium]
MSQAPPPGPPPGQAGPPPAGGPPAYGGGAGQPTDAQGRVLAHWWKRVVASLIDGVILAVPYYILTAIIGIGAANSVKCETDVTTGITSCNGGTGFFVTFLITMLIFFILGIVYFVYFNGSERGQTPGKMVMKIQVRDEATGGPIGYGKAALRWVVALVLSILCYIPGIVDALFPLWDAKRQTLHDKAANSLVIDLNP